MSLSLHRGALGGGWNVDSFAPLQPKGPCKQPLIPRHDLRALKHLRLGYAGRIHPLCFHGCTSSSTHRPDKERSAAKEALGLLEWPRLCKAVAEFADTDLGKERVLVLHLPDSKEESEIMLSETYAATVLISADGGACYFGMLQASLIKQTLEKIGKGYVFSGLEAIAIKKLLQCSQSLKQSIDSFFFQQSNECNALQPLLGLAGPLGRNPDLTKTIDDAVDEDGLVKDDKYPSLKQARLQVQSLELKLQELLQKVLQEKAGIEASEREIVNVDGRLCLALSSEMGNKVSGLLLQSDPYGNVGYFEPTTLVPLNDKLSEARSMVIQAEYTVLSDLRKKILPFVDEFMKTLLGIVSFDVIMARAKYGSHMGATKPLLVDGQSVIKNTDHAAHLVDGTGSLDYLVQLRCALHPLLVQQHLERLNEAKLGLKSKQKMLNRLRSKAGTTIGAINEMEAVLSTEKDEVEAMQGAAPKAIDILIKRKTRVVTITGPNTGGKTVTMKTLGLAALMAKAGLFLLASEPAYIPWFDNVYADIGDQQSLQESLSTFSGHISRIKQIRAESTGSSLVLLDEVGAGTDSIQGAALGMAILESLSQSALGGSLLTLATTHHPELKILKYRDSAFENACMEFDEQELKPTFKLLWGIPGRSNALSIAERLGLPKEIVVNAKALQGVDRANLNQIIMDLETTRISFQHNVEKGEQLLLEAKLLYEKLIASAKEIDEFSIVLEQRKVSHIGMVVAGAYSTLHKLAREAKKK